MDEKEKELIRMNGELQEKELIRMIAELQALILDLRENNDVNLVVMASYRNALLIMTEDLITNFLPLFKNSQTLKIALEALNQVKMVRM